VPLANADLVHVDQEGDWFLTADLAEITLGDLHAMLPFMLPIDDIDALPVSDELDQTLHNALQEMHDAAGPLLRRSVKFYVTRPEKRIE